MGDRTVLILGGGVGGVVAAHRLRARLPRQDRVVLFDREAQHVFQPSLLWVATGARTPDRIQRPLARLRGKGIEVIQAEVEAIDPARRSVRAGGRELAGDALIVALGAELAPESIPGLAEGGCNLYSLPGARAVHADLARRRDGRVVVLTAAPAYKCPAAPYEAAMLIDGYLRERGVRASVELDLYAAEAGPMGVAGPAVSAGVRRIVESKGIRYHPEHQLTAVDPVTRTLSFANGATATYDLLVYVPPHRAPAVVRASGLAGEAGWIGVDRRTLETAHPGVYAIGDVTTIPLKMGKPLPKAGVFAHRQAEVVADNLVAAWTGQGAPRVFDGHGECFLETGQGRAGFGAGNFYAEPTPEVTLRAPSRWWHWGKVLFEWRWLRRWFQA
ncbi:MAG: NAD(P)/FAD-dependent oxidoreductase [Gemmatimonadota bacterium]